MDGVLEMEHIMDAMLLGFEEINSTIDKYLNNLESNDDEELVPRKKSSQQKYQTNNPPP